MTSHPTCRSLFYMFEDELHEAIKLLDNEAFTVLFTKAGRQVYEVNGSEGRVYHCFKHAYYCTCLSFKHHGTTV